jgi:thermitase
LSRGRRLFLLVAALMLAVSAAAHASGTVIVKYRSGTSHAERRAASRDAGAGRTIGRVRRQGARVVRVRGNPSRVARRLRRSAAVRYAELNRRLRTLGAPNDPLFGELAGMRAIHVTDGWSIAGIGSFPADGGVPVAIVDTGIDSRHGDLPRPVACASARNGRIEEGRCADDNDHGSHVAGTVAAVANNRTGVAGVAFNSPLIVCKALAGRAGSGTTADVANCISWAHDQGAKVISMSLGGSASITLRKAVRLAWADGGRRGSVLVAAAGNDGSSAVEHPAGYDEVVSVAASDSAGRHASFSNTNDDVEIAAPGVSILSTKRGGGYVRFSGTSMATPHVAGAAALLWDLHRRAAATTIRGRLDAAVTDRGADGRDARFGFGMLDLARLPRG